MELDFDIRIIFKAFRDHWITILIVGLLFAIAIGLYSSCLIPEKYSATTMLQIVNKNNADYAQDAITSALPYLGHIFEKMSKSSDAIKVLYEYLIDSSNGLGRRYTDLSESQLKSMISVKSDDYGFLTYTVTTSDQELSYDIAKAIYKLFPNEFTNGSLNSYKVPVRGHEGPSMPTSPSYPNVKLYTVIAGLGGIFLSWLFFFIISIVDVSIITKKDLTDKFDIPVIGEIPLWGRSK